jgi:hypothetical protein
VFRYINISLLTLVIGGVASAASIDPAVTSSYSSSDGSLYSSATIPAGFSDSSVVSAGWVATSYPLPADTSNFKASNISGYAGSSASNTDGGLTCPYGNIFGLGQATCEIASDFIFENQSLTSPSLYTLTFTLDSPTTVYGFSMYLLDQSYFGGDNTRGASVVEFYDGTVSPANLVTEDVLTNGTNSYAQTYGGHGDINLTDYFAEGVTGQTFSFTFTGVQGTRVMGVSSIDSPVPEPGTWMLAGFGMLGLYAATKMRARRLQSKL